MDISRISGAAQAPSGAHLQPANKAATPAPAAPVAPDRAVQATPAQAAVNQAELTRSIEAINRFLQPVNGDIVFSQDDETGRTLVKIIDTKTQTVLRQIPSKEVVAISKELDKLQGLLVRDKV